MHIGVKTADYIPKASLAGENLHLWKILLICIKRTRPAIGSVFGFTLMYAAMTGVFSIELLSMAIIFALTYLFIDIYNDYWDFEEDVKNGRTEKITVSGLLPRESVKNLYRGMLILALTLATLTNVFAFAYVVYVALIGFAYSHPKVRLKNHDFFGYIIVCTLHLAIPFIVDLSMGRQFGTATLLFGLFFFAQFNYILCQKDSTDFRDKTNLFIKRGWNTAAAICFGYASLASGILLAASIGSPVLLLFWGMNTFLAKAPNLYFMAAKALERDTRYILIGFEYLLPLLYFAWAVAGA